MALLTYDERAAMVKRIDAEIKEAQFAVHRANDALKRLRALRKATIMVHTGDPAVRACDVIVSPSRQEENVVDMDALTRAIIENYKRRTAQE